MTALKASSGWDFGDSHKNGTNVSGFSMLPSGARTAEGVYTSLGVSGYLWSTEEEGSEDTYLGKYDRNIAISVRCLKD